MGCARRGARWGTDHDYTQMELKAHRFHVGVTGEIGGHTHEIEGHTHSGATGDTLPRDWGTHHGDRHARLWTHNPETRGHTIHCRDRPRTHTRDPGPTLRNPGTHSLSRGEIGGHTISGATGTRTPGTRGTYQGRHTKGARTRDTPFVAGLRHWVANTGDIPCGQACATWGAPRAPSPGDSPYARSGDTPTGHPREKWAREMGTQPLLRAGTGGAGWGGWRTAGPGTRDWAKLEGHTIEKLRARLGGDTSGTAILDVGHPCPGTEH